MCRVNGNDCYPGGRRNPEDRKHFPANTAAPVAFSRYCPRRNPGAKHPKMYPPCVPGRHWKSPGLTRFTPGILGRQNVMRPKVSFLNPGYRLQGYSGWGSTVTCAVAVPGHPTPYSLEYVGCGLGKMQENLLGHPPPNLATPSFSDAFGLCFQSQGPVRPSSPKPRCPPLLS